MLVFNLCKALNIVYKYINNIYTKSGRLNDKSHVELFTLPVFHYTVSFQLRSKNINMSSKLLSSYAQPWKHLVCQLSSRYSICFIVFTWLQFVLFNQISKKIDLDLSAEVILRLGKKIPIGTSCRLWPFGTYGNLFSDPNIWGDAISSLSISMVFIYLHK